MVAMKRKIVKIIIIVSIILIIASAIAVPIAVSNKNKTYAPNAMQYGYYTAFLASISVPSWTYMSIQSDIPQHKGGAKYIIDGTMTFYGQATPTNIKLEFDKGNIVEASSDKKHEMLTMFNKDFVYDSNSEDEAITKLFADIEESPLSQAVMLQIGFKETISAEEFLLSDFRKKHQILFAPIDLRSLGNYYSAEIENQPVLGMHLHDDFSIVPPAELDAVLGVNRQLFARRANSSVNSETVAIEKLLAPKYVFEEILQRMAKQDVNENAEKILNYGIHNGSAINLERTADYYFHNLRFTQYGNVGPQVMGCQIICNKDQIAGILSYDNYFLIKHSNHIGG